MEIKKRDFLTGGVIASVGLTAVARSGMAAAQVPSGVPKALGKTMLESPNYFGTASKGGGFHKSWARTLPQVSTTDPNYKPRRFNKAIELWEDDQVVFYDVYMPTGAGDGYEEGKRMSQTWADAINYEMENGCFDFADLRNFMQGLVDGGPTPSGHRTPMVYVTLPAPGFDGPSMRANAWQIQQSLAAGAHGVLMCEVHSPEAGVIAISAGRYKFTQPGVPRQPLEGLRGAGSQAFAAHIWGMNGRNYLQAADTWPLNPKGEICMGFKLENRLAAENAEELMAIPGLAFAEPGPSDNSWSILGWQAAAPASREDYLKAMSDPRLVGALERIRMAAKENRIQWLGTGSPGSNLIQSYDQGMRMLPAPKEEDARAVREHSKRKMPA